MLIESLKFKVLKLNNFQLQPCSLHFAPLTSKGQSLIELIIAIAIAAAIMPALFFGLITSTQAKPQENQSLAANALLKEGEEAVRSAREANWSNIATNGNYHPAVVSGVWSLMAGSETLNQFTRTILITDTQRDLGGNIVSSGGTVDPSTKKITNTVSWSTPYSSSVTSTLYLTRYLNNTAIVQPSPAPPGVPFSTYSSSGSSGIVVTSSSVGIGTSSGGGKGDWCVYNPAILTRFNMSGSSPANALWAVAGAVYAGTGNSASGVDIQALSLTQPAFPAPPAVSALWTDGNNNFKTNDIYADTNFSYLATNANKQQVVVFDNSLSSNPRAVRSSYNLGTNNNANGVAALSNGLGDIVYAVTRDGGLYTMDRNLTGVRISPLGNLALGGNGNRIKVIQINSATYAFIAMSSTTNQLKIVPILTNSTFGTPINLDLGNNLIGQDVDISPDGTRAYIATSYSPGKQNIFIVDISTITSPKVVGSANTNGMNPVSLSMVLSKNRLIVVGSGGVYQYQVFNISAEVNPQICGGLTSTASDPFTMIYDVASFYDVTNDRAYGYIVTNDSSNEFKVIEGGPGSQVGSQGIYESATFDAGSNVSFNRFQATFLQPAGTNITFQVAVSQAINGSCTGVSFSYQNLSNITISTTGSTATYNGAVTYPNNQGRCFRYRATLTPSSDFTQSPSLQSVQINYTP